MPNGMLKLLFALLTREGVHELKLALCVCVCESHGIRVLLRQPLISKSG